MKILIVDDDDDNLNLLETLLRLSGYETVSAGNGVEALEKLRNDSIDIIVSDTLMPRMDGFQFCKECKKDDSLMRIPFVFYTSVYTDKKDEEFALSLGAEKFVIKPLELDSLLDILKTVVEDQRKALPVTPKTYIEDKEDCLVEYNKRLVMKLEKKVLDLEKEMDIRRLMERRFRAQYFVTQVLVESVTIKEALPKILQAVCTVLEWDLGEIWVFDSQDSVLKCSEIWHIPSIEVLEFKKLTKQITFSKGIGLPGSVFSSAKPVWVADVAHDTNFLRAAVADKEGLHGAFGFPIHSGSGILGTICFFSHEIREPDEDLLNMLSAIGAQIGLFIKRKQADEEIRKLLHAIEYSSATVIITDIDGNIEYVNPKFTELTGYSLEGVIGKTPRILKSGKTPPEVYKCLWKAITSGNEWQGELCNRKKSGELYWEYVSISAVRNAEGIITQFVAIKEDITGRKEAESKRETLESQVRQLQKLDAIGTLAGGIAHDFNNILTPILGFVQMSFLDLEPDSKIYYNLEHISRAANRAKELVGQILTFSRNIEMGPRPLMIHFVVKEVLKLVRASLPAIIDIKPNIDTECGIVLADETKIHQVIMNLCTNASDAMKDSGGVLAVSLNRIKVDAELASKHHNLSEGNYVLLKVKDTGHGMSAETIKHLFEPFFTTKDIGKGTGLGLSVVHGIVLGYGGDITVESNLGIGSTFFVYLPTADVDVERKETKQEPIAGGRENILYVDDEEEICIISKLILEKFGYRVTTITNSLKALEEFRNNSGKYDLVMTDLMMPCMTGDKLAIELVHIRPYIPVILTTGFGDAFKPEDCKRLGIRDYVMKPFDARCLAKAIRNALKK